MSTGLAQSLRSISERLEQAAIPYMVAGSFASTYYGHPRATQDVDMVIDPTNETIDRFLVGLPPEHFYADRQSALEALATRDMFNVIDLETGWKVDLIVRKARSFSRVELERRIPAEWMGVPIFVASPEDVILSKLEWARRSGGSERQLRDVVGVIESMAERLDRAYIEGWIDELGVRALWEGLGSKTT